MHYGPIMIDLEGTKLKPEEYALLKHPQVGGIILFSRNYQNIAQLKALVSEIRGVAEHPVLIAVDHEGGRIWQFKEGFTHLPAAKQYGLWYQENVSKALQLARNAGWIMAAEFLDCGIDLSFAPVLDLEKGLSEVIGDRAIHSDPLVVTELAKAFIEGMNTVGMSATGKHFPGHGRCTLDSHVFQPTDARSFEELTREDLIPFIQLTSVLGAIMPAHIIYSALDTVPPAFSKRWLQEILRRQFKFSGTIISDCLSMKGAAIGGDFVVRARLAIDAGCDMVILSRQVPELVTWILDNLDRENSVESSKRLAALAGNFQNKTRQKPRPVLEKV